MPEWMTPLVRPVWCAATRSSFSRTTTRAPGWRSSNAIAVARPTIPPPTTAMSQLTGNRPSGCFGYFAGLDVFRAGMRVMAALTVMLHQRRAHHGEAGVEPQVAQRPRPGEAERDQQLLPAQRQRVVGRLLDDGRHHQHVAVHPQAHT